MTKGEILEKIKNYDDDTIIDVAVVVHITTEGERFVSDREIEDIIPGFVGLRILGNFESLPPD